MANNGKGIGPRGLGSAFKQTNKFKEFGEKLSSRIESGDFDISPETGYVVKHKESATGSGSQYVKGGERGKREYFNKYTEPSAENFQYNPGGTTFRKYVSRPGQDDLSTGEQKYNRLGGKKTYDKKVYLNDSDNKREFAAGGSLSSKSNKGASSIVSDYFKKQKQSSKPSIDYKKGDLLDSVDVVSKIKYGSGSGGGETYKDTPQYKELMGKLNKKGDTKKSYKASADTVTKGGKKYIGSGGSISATNPSTGRTTQIPVSFSPSAGKQEVRPESMFSGTQTMMDRFKKFTGGRSKQKFQYGASNVEAAGVGTGSRPGQIQYGAQGASKIISERGTKKGQSGFSDYLTEKLNVMASKSADTKRSDLKAKRSSSKKKYKK